MGAKENITTYEGGRSTRTLEESAR